jgi:hypothetical protein
VKLDADKNTHPLYNKTLSPIVAVMSITGTTHMSEPQKSDALKKLVWFIIALAILGTFIAMIHYFAVDLPLQQALLHAPTNTVQFGSKVLLQG